jgi:phosphopantetheinyl transferase
MTWQNICNLNEINATENLVLLYGRSYDGHANKTAPECRALLRMLLSRFLNLPPEHIVIQKTKSGKPFVENKGLFFNVSHSDSSYLIAVSRMGRIGVDIECLTGNEDLVSMADYAFSEHEKRVCFETDDRIMNFTKIWTLKEALLKATGSGLADNLAQQDVFEKLYRYKLDSISFLCPENETASVVFRRGTGITAEPRYFCLEQAIPAGL